MTAATGSLPSPRGASSHPSFPPRPLVPPFSRTQDCCHCLVLQCQCSSLQSSPGRYCPSYLRHFWGRYLVLKLVKQPRIGITCHVNILQKQPSVLSSRMKILNMPQKMWQQLNWKGSVCHVAELPCWDASYADLQPVLLPFICCFSFQITGKQKKTLRGRVCLFMLFLSGLNVVILVGYIVNGLNVLMWCAPGLQNQVSQSQRQGKVKLIWDFWLVDSMWTDVPNEDI